MATYASARLDGLFVCSTLQAGILQNATSPAVRFTVAAGVQHHPVWALDRLALVVYAYCRASTGSSVEVNLEGSLVSNESTSIVVANRIQWHTSRKVRTTAEQLISELALTGRLPKQWPADMLSLPVSFPE